MRNADFVLLGLSLVTGRGAKIIRLCAGRLAGSCCPFVLAAQRLRALLRPHDVSPHEELGDRLYPGGERGDLNWGRDL